MALLAAVKRGDRPEIEKLSRYFHAFDAARAAHSAIPVVHAALKYVGIAETGPMGPFFDTDYDAATAAHITRVAQELMEANAAWQKANAGGEPAGG
jgi:dihydrodipicolinate synthase/N-acetylneuraminate lyase